jgi:hypothetical protein
LLLPDPPGARMTVHTPSDHATWAALSILVAPAGGSVRAQAD